MSEQIISRTEALQIARQTLERAERERAEDRMTGTPLGNEIDDLRRQLDAVTAERNAARACLQEIGEWASQGRQGKRHCDLRELQGMVDAALRESEQAKE